MGLPWPDEFERARWIEQRKLEEENRALRRRIDEIERRAAPAPATTNTSDSMVVGDLLGDGVNDELIQQKLAKLQVPVSERCKLLRIYFSERMPSFKFLNAVSPVTTATDPSPSSLQAKTGASTI